jgi:uncharacterized surface protein with fasciclin (FAS1) repeats
MKRMAMLMVAPLMLGMAACSDDPIAPQPGNIVEVAAEAGSFTTLIAAVEAAGLAGVLQGDGPFTVFAPTDEAFAQLPAGTVEALLNDIPTLTAILTYHVVPGRVTSADLVNSGGAQPATVQGQTLTIEVNGGTVTVDGATVVAADVMASNGVIHVIDAVILPSL